MVGGWHSRIESLQVYSTWTLDLDLDCDNYLMIRNAGVEHVESNDAVTENILYIF